MKKLLLLLMACILVAGQAFSQSRTLSAEKKVVPLIRCSSHEKHLEAIAADPSIVQKMAEIEANTQKWISENSNQQKAVITIPTVVQLWVTAAQVSDARVQEQIDVLNKDFRRQNTDASDTPAQFVGVAADCEVEFCLASIDPDGNPTTGIIRRTAGGSPSNADNWDPSSYLNIYVYSIGGGTLGYTYSPGGAPAGQDAVNIDYNYFGITGASAPYNLGRTATHEVGHWLNLIHIWGDSNCGNDQCSDTPTQEQESFGCPNNQNTCGSDDMTSNYMDYSNDGCMDIFSQDQKSRVQATLAGYRASLQNSQGCAGGTGVNAGFSGTPTSVIVGSSVTYSDNSFGNPTTWSWTFAGGTPANSTVQNPVVTYSTVGTYDVELTVSDGTNTDTETKVSYISVVDQPGDGDCDTTGNVLYNTGLVIGGITGATGYSTGHNSYEDAAYAEKFTYNAPFSDLYGTIIYLGVAMGTGSVTLNVWGDGAIPGTALASKTVNIADLQVGRNYITWDNMVSISTDYYIGMELTYAAGDTVAIQMSPDGSITTNTAYLQYSDNTWLDYETVYEGGIASLGIYPDICTPGGTGGIGGNAGGGGGGSTVTELSAVSNFNVYPNPSSGAFTVDLRLSSEEDVTISVYNLVGKQVNNITKNNFINGQINLNLTNQSKGLYFVAVRTKAGVEVKKINIIK